MKAKIKEKKEVAKDTLLVNFDLLGERISFKPGQYFFITLLNPPYTDNDEKGSRRHFSVVSSPIQNDIITMATRIRESSAFKKSLKELAVGSVVEIGPIQGSFVLPQDSTFPLVLIAGGIGITPFMSMLKFAFEKSLPLDLTLAYSNKNRESTAFFEELQQFKKEHQNFNLILTMTEDDSWIGEKGRIDENFIKKYFQDLNTKKYMIAGPPPMVDATYNVLLSSGVDPLNIKKENFSGY